MGEKTAIPTLLLPLALLDVGLFRGLGPTLLRDAPFSGLYLLFYEKLKAVGHGTVSSHAHHMAAGLGAGFLASLVTHPVDVLKTHMQVSPHRCTWAAAFRSIVAVRPRIPSVPCARPGCRALQTHPRRLDTCLVRPPQAHGLAGLFRGALPRVVRRACLAALNWTLFEDVSACPRRFLVLGSVLHVLDCALAFPDAPTNGRSATDLSAHS